MPMESSAICMRGVSMIDGDSGQVTNLAVLDDEAVSNTGREHLEHLAILHVVADMLKDVGIRDDT